MGKPERRMRRRVRVSAAGMALVLAACSGGGGEVDLEDSGLGPTTTRPPASTMIMPSTLPPSETTPATTAAVVTTAAPTTAAAEQGPVTYDGKPCYRAEVAIKAGDTVLRILSDLNSQFPNPKSAANDIYRVSWAGDNRGGVNANPEKIIANTKAIARDCDGFADPGIKYLDGLPPQAEPETPAPTTTVAATTVPTTIATPETTTTAA